MPAFASVASAIERGFGEGLSLSLSLSRLGAIEIREVDAAAVRPLRGRVLRPGGKPADLVYPSDSSPGAFHLAACAIAVQGPTTSAQYDPTGRPGAVLGIVSLSPEARADGHGRAPYRLRGMATAPGVRGAGLGSQLLAAALEEIGRRGGDLVWCNARTTAEGFYRRHGFRPLGAVFELPEIGPHRLMERGMSPK